MVLPITGLDNIPNNQNGWIEEDAKEEEEDPEEDPVKDPKEDPEGDDDDVIEMDDEEEVINPYMDDGLNNPPPPNSKDEETPHTSPVIPDADGKMEKLMSERIDTEGRMKKKFKEQDRHFESTEASIQDERERVQNEANRTEGPNVAPVSRECTFADFMMCIPITFRGNEGAVATIGIEIVTRKTWAEIKVMMTEEFCPPKEIQRMEENIKGKVTSSKPTTLNKAVRMAHTLMEQKAKAISKKEADNKKRKWENFQGGSSSGGGNNNSNRNNNNNYNSNRNYNNNRNNNQNQYRNPNQNH
nr:hypothetical protein [Tanacetum cinerariifolium]